MSHYSTYKIREEWYARTRTHRNNLSVAPWTINGVAEKGLEICLLDNFLVQGWLHAPVLIETETPAGTLKVGGDVAIDPVPLVWGGGLGMLLGCDWGFQYSIEDTDAAWGMWTIGWRWDTHSYGSEKALAWAIADNMFTFYDWPGWEWLRNNQFDGMSFHGGFYSKAYVYQYIRPYQQVLTDSGGGDVFMYQMMVGKMPPEPLKSTYCKTRFPNNPEPFQ